MRTSGVILAGGMSRRLGTDKALVSVDAGGESLLTQMIRCLRPLVDDLAIVAPDRAGYQQSGVSLIPDAFPGEGPLGGIVTALRTVTSERCLVVGCDYPFLSTPLLRWLCEQQSDTAAIVPTIPAMLRGEWQMVLQPAQAIYDRNALLQLEQAFVAGERSLTRALAQVEYRQVPIECIMRFDPGLRSFFSINTPDDLNLARQISNHGHFRDDII